MSNNFHKTSLLKNGEGKKRNEFAEWNVERRAEWHNYAK